MMNNYKNWNETKQHYKVVDKDLVIVKILYSKYLSFFL